MASYVEGQVADLAADHHAFTVTADPLWSSLFGAPGADPLLPDGSAEGDARTAARLRDVERRARALLTEPLREADRVTVEALLHDAVVRAQTCEGWQAEIGVSGLRSPHGLLFHVLPKAPGGAAGEPDRLARLEQVSGYLDRAAGRFRAGAAAGRVPSRRSVEQALGQLDAYLSTRTDQDPLAVGLPPSHTATRLLTDVVRPAFVRYRATLAEVTLPAAREDDRPGLAHLPGGEELYAQAVHEHTTTDLSPDDVHALGLRACAAVRDELALLGQRVLGSADPAVVAERLRHDPALRYETSAAILQDAGRALERAQEALPAWFGRLPGVPCEVAAIPDLEAPDSVLGYYQPPAGSRPGRHWVNTHDPASRTRYEYEALAFHESIPGHHVQFAVAQQQDLPDFRRFSYVAAFSEGWALYAERLADEMGLYSGDLARLGMLSFDAWRACRLVVDTGLHARGWSRRQAIDFLHDHSALTPGNIANEVDRYVAWPGQALSYMVGRLELERLRREAQQVSGPHWSLPAFHDVVLGGGGLPLSVLDGVVQRWVQRLVEPSGQPVLRGGLV